VASVGESRHRSLLRKVFATLAILAATAGLELFVALGSFDGPHEHFSSSVAVQP
jgi:hypothetical protein